VVDPDLLVRSLPASRGCAVLSAGASRVEPALGPPPREAIDDVLETVARASTPLIVDLPRWQYWPPDLDLHTWILLTGTRTRELADLDALLHQIDGRRLSGRQAVVVTTGPEPDRALIEAIEDHVGLTHIGHVPRQPALVHAMERGRWPGSRPIAGLLDNLQRRGRPSAA
jgi:sugar/nucleoside kinase (ribokinase family)